ncbi:hypothetical protein BOSE62_70129 [Bosea sp. 62]|nr:hypothetical protein BOSE46_90430 [Bosea sp. 46]VXB66714.1 hypothetical protein BOSE125_140142 [Bosea sp. 125]VXC69475.1 hypothetical protein BOSE62_70129 [Bosea sp. 62]VXC95611.1 hypothetical protein BOSE29B_90047 [Bosea sp. 29B]
MRILPSVSYTPSETYPPKGLRGRSLLDLPLRAPNENGAHLKILFVYRISPYLPACHPAATDLPTNQ